MGKKPTDFLVWLIWAAAVCACLTVIGGFAVALKTWLILPALAVFQSDPSPSGLNGFATLLAFGVTAGAVIGMGRQIDSIRRFLADNAAEKNRDDPA